MQCSGKKSIQTNRDKSDALRHIMQESDENVELQRLYKLKRRNANPRIRHRIQTGIFRPIRVDHTNCLQVAIKTHSPSCRSWLFWHPYVKWVTRGEGGRFHFRARDAKSMTDVIRSKSQRSVSRARIRRPSRPNSMTSTRTWSHHHNTTRCWQRRSGIWNKLIERHVCAGRASIADSTGSPWEWCHRSLPCCSSRRQDKTLMMYVRMRIPVVQIY